MICPVFSIPSVADNSPTIPESLRRSMPIESRTPPSLISARNPIAATTVGVTNGRVNAARITPILFHLYRPSHHAIGRPIARVSIADKLA